MLETLFWRHAAASLPAQVRGRYALQLRGAERFDRRLERVARAWRGLKAALKPRSRP